TSALATIQTGWFITRAPAWVDWVIIGTICMGSLWIPRLRRRTVPIAAALGLIAYVCGALALFSRHLVWLPILLPVGLLLFVVVYRLATPKWAGKPRRPVLM